LEAKGCGAVGVTSGGHASAGWKIGGMDFSESLRLAVAYAEAGYDHDADALQRVRGEIAAGGGPDDVLAVMAGLLWIVAEAATGDSPDPQALKDLLRAASTELEIRGSF
jgi:hypothetical protein